MFFQRQEPDGDSRADLRSPALAVNPPESVSKKAELLIGRVLVLIFAPQFRRLVVRGFMLFQVARSVNCPTARQLSVMFVTDISVI